jgi:hypothetical protein
VDDADVRQRHAFDISRGEQLKPVADARAP